MFTAGGGVGDGGRAGGRVAASASMFALGRNRGPFGFAWRGRGAAPNAAPNAAPAVVVRGQVAAAVGGGGVMPIGLGPSGAASGDRPPLEDVCAKEECAAKEQIACGTCSAAQFERSLSAV